MKMQHHRRPPGAESEVDEQSSAKAVTPIGVKQHIDIDSDDATPMPTRPVRRGAPKVMSIEPSPIPPTRRTLRQLATPGPSNNASPAGTVIATP